MGLLMDWDFIVCGAGTAGIPAAMFAAQRGLRVLVVDGAKEVGGTLHVAAGQVSAAGTRLQAERGIEDSAERHYQDILRISNGRASPEHARIVAENAADTLHWLVSLGWRPLPEHPVLFGHNPYSVPRTYWGSEGGKSILQALGPAFLAEVKAGRIALRLETELTELLQGSDGRVGGVVTRDASGQQSVLPARNTLLATGGYGASKALFPLFTDGYPGFGWAQPTSMGSGHVAALSVGGVMRGQDLFLPRYAGVENPLNPARTERYTELSPTRRPPWEIYLDTNGRRFVAEDDATADGRERALKRLKNLTFWVVFDHGVLEGAPPLFDRSPPGGFERWLGQHPSYCRAGSVEELATCCGMLPEILMSEINEYNQACTTGSDRLGRKHLPRRIAQAPFYAIKHHGTGSVSIAGIAVDKQMRVVNSKGQPIPGLYAAGEILGLGLHSGDAFVGGMGIMPALTSGRLLGQAWIKHEGGADNMVQSVVHLAD